MTGSVMISNLVNAINTETYNCTETYNQVNVQRHITVVRHK